ncbi:MAG: methyltransferase domain-containing protein [Alkalinema sp. RU_4_3]|nr:methyltransferase domain-containing protein [Alkalinema sp. RU_4_3]
MQQELISYEAAVHWMREQPHYAEMIEHCYLDRDNLASAERFAASEEFGEACRLLGLRPGQPKRVLDLGCGNGIASYAFANRGCAVMAVDPDMSDDVGLMAAERLREKISRGSITIAQATAESLPFADDTFDVIYERQALHHFSDLPKGLTECARVLKPGGRFLAAREHVVTDGQQLAVFLQEHILHQLHGGENAYTVAHYQESLRNAGLTVVKTMAPMDNVINHFPVSNAEVRQAMTDWLTARVGRRLGSAIARLPFIETAYRHRQSRRNQSPGRVYSFLCSKGDRL